MMLVQYLLCALPLFVQHARCAQIAAAADQLTNATTTTTTSDAKTADLSPLLNETLAINNRTVYNGTNAQLSSSGHASLTAFRDDWTFDMIEYDLMDFLQDLSARYSQNKTSTTPASVEARADKTQTQTQTTTTTSVKQTMPVTAAPMSTSLATGDHEIAESSWSQYGIFDRFTRARAPPTSSTTSAPARDPLDSVAASSSSSSSRFDVREFNSDECGLRTYDTRAQFYPSPSDVDAAALDASNADAIQELKQRRQKPSQSTLEALAGEVLRGSTEQHRKTSNNNNDALLGGFVSSDAIDAFEDGLQIDNQEAAAQSAPDLASGAPKQHVAPQPHGGGGGQQQSSSGADAGATLGEAFNLSSRRYWLQQQLSNTLQMLGFNASIQSAAEFLNQTAGLSTNMRENMMKMSGGYKLAKSSLLSHPSTMLSERKNYAAAASSDDDNTRLEARVIGGSDARLGDSPWSVSLQALVSRPGTGAVEYRHYCGGTIIGERHVLTAAHCLDFMVGRESRLFVVIGDLNWRMNAASLHGRRFGIEKLIIHSGYKSTAFGHDIGIIRTKEPMRPVKVNGRYIVNSVCLPERNVEHSGEAELVGWGLFSNRNEMADTLQIADVPILPRPLCVDLYRRRTGLIQWLIGIELITDKQLCAGTFGRGICQGDSGSALVYNERRPAASAAAAAAAAASTQRNKRNLAYKTDQQRATIIGIVAFGGIRRCSYQSLPGVYMQTSKYMDWILPRIN